MIQNLAISYPDFTLNTIIDPDQFDTNNTEIVNKLNELLNKLHSIDGAREIIADGIEGVSGSVDLQTMLIAIKQYIDTGDSDTDLYNKYNELVTALDTNKAYNEATFRKKIDSYSKIEADNKLALKADKTTTYTKTQTDALVAGVTLGQIPNNSLAEIKMANDMKKDIVGGVASYNEYKTFKDNTSNSLTDMTNKLNNLNTNDVQARQEIIDIKLKLKEQQSIDFINKTGIGYYDLFKDKTGIDEPNTTATIDTSNHKVVFPTVDRYTVKSVGAFTDVAEIKVDKNVNVKDRVNDIEVLNKTAVEEIGTNEVIDATVANSAYDTSGNGGRKLVMLSNGWLVCAIAKVSSGIYFYKSEDNGNIWTQLCYIASGSATINGCIVSKGIYVYVLTNGVYYNYFNATTVENTNIGNIGLDTAQTSVSDNCSLVINSAGTELHACWSSKNSTYPNSFNIRYTKGTIGADGSVTWGTAEQITITNVSGVDNKNPTIVINKDNNPVIIYERAQISSNQLYSVTYNGSTWVQGSVYVGNSYTQSSPSSIFVPKEINGLPNGRIWVAWHGKDATDTTYYNVRVSYSDDGGITWSATQKLTSGNTSKTSSVSPSITANANNETFIVYQTPNNGADTLYDIYYMKNINGVWETPILKKESTYAQHMYDPSALFDANFKIDFTEPLFIYKDNLNKRVGFYGTWQDTITNYNLSLASTITTTDKQELTVQPYKLKNLKMLPQTFDNFDNINLALYPTKINKATIKEAVNNSTTVVTGATDKEITVGDKLFMNGVLNEVLTSTGNYANNDVQDATVVNQSYDTSGNGGRKLVRLSNGWLVAVVKTNYYYYFYKSEDNGNTWVDLCYTNIQTNTTHDIAIASKNNIIYFIHNMNNTAVNFQYFDATTVLNKDIYEFNNISSESVIGNMSLTINSLGTELHACWSSKNSTYPNSFNIRYAKGTINTDGSVSWGSVVQVTNSNTSVQDFLNPSIIIKHDGFPVIFDSFSMSGTNDIRAHVFTSETIFSTKVVHAGGSYIQSSPSAIFVPKEVNGLPNGRIWVAWQGTDATDTVKTNIRVSYSDDNGITWSAMQKLTSGNSYDQGIPSITCSKNGDIYIVFRGATNTSNNYYRLRKIKYTDNTWGNVLDITNNSTITKNNPATLYDININFTEPIFIYSELKVGFYGTWTIGEGYTLTMKNQTTLSANVQVPIVDLEARQATADMVLKDIDEEKFIYDCSNLNTTTSDITILGSATELDTMSYAIS